MNIKAGVFTGRLTGIAIISAVTFITAGYGAEPAREYYNNRQLRFESYYQDGNLKGLFKNYYKNGQVKSEGVFRNGEFEGLLRVYYENGKLKIEGVPTSGEYGGLFKEYDEKGQLKR